VSAQASAPSAAAFVREVGVLGEILDLWWAAKAVHETLDGVDVEAILGRMIAEIDHSLDLFRYAVLLRTTLWRLCDGHLAMAPSPQRFETAYTSGLALSSVDEGVVLIGSDAGCTQSREALVAGDVVAGVDGVPAEVYIGAYSGRPGSTERHRRKVAVDGLSWQERYPGEQIRPQKLRLMRRNGSEYTVELRWQAVPHARSTPDAVRGVVTPSGVGILRVRTFACRDELGQVSDREFLRQLQSAARAVEQAEVLGVDLRDNAGGSDGQAQILARSLLGDGVEWFRFRHRQPYGFESDWSAPGVVRLGAGAQEASLRRNTDRLYVITSPGTFSTSEVFAAACKANGVRCIGERTGGGAGNPVEFRLPYSGLAITIPISQIFGASGSGELIEGRGVAPDAVVTPTRRAVYACRDEAVEYLEMLAAGASQ
jgi:C-terminal processing protease CtpA/Prc